MIAYSSTVRAWLTQAQHIPSTAASGIDGLLVVNGTGESKNLWRLGEAGLP